MKRNSIKNLTILLLFLNNICLFAQNWNVTKPKLIKTENIRIDSVKVEISYYEDDGIVTESYFEKSKSKLNITYSRFDKSSFQIFTRENSLSPDDLWRMNLFKFENGKISSRKEQICMSGRGIGECGKVENEYLKNFNRTLDSKFVEMYIVKLLKRIKNYW